MKILSSCLLILISISSLAAQENKAETEVKETIQEFFQAFHEQDSIKLRAMVVPSIYMQSIAVDSSGNSELESEEYSKFSKSIVSIPSTTKFEERLISFDIRMNGALASVITPYSFYVNDILSHCGVNSFQLYRTEGEWKIIHIVDTRKKEGCK